MARHHKSKRHHSGGHMGTGMGMNREMNPESREFYADDDMIHDNERDMFNLPQEVMRKTYKNPSMGLPGELRYGIDEVNREQSENHMQMRKQFKISRS